MFITLKVGPDYLLFCSGAPAEGLVEPDSYGRENLKVSIICRFIFLRIELKLRFACTKFCGIGTGSTISNSQYCQ